MAVSPIHKFYSLLQQPLSPKLVAHPYIDVNEQGRVIALYLAMIRFNITLL
jgi:hypothetical protein